NELAERAAAANPNSLELKGQLANSWAVLGSFYLKVDGDVKAARDYLENALELRRQRLAAEPDSDEAKLGVANALGQLAICHQDQGELDAAKALFEQEAQIRASLSPPAQHDFETRRELAGLYEKLGLFARQLGDLPGARKNYDRCSAIRKALAEESP